MDYLRKQNTEIEELASDTPRQLVTSGQHKLVLVIAENYAERYAKGNLNTLLLIHDSSELSSTRRHLSVLRGHINRYSRTIGLLRLQLRGVDPAVTRPINLQEVDVASPAARALMY